MKNLIHNAYIEILAGIARIHSDGGVISENKWGKKITITFPDLDPRKAVVRRYYKNGKRYWEVEYYEGQRHGKYLSYHDNGEKWEEVEYYEGQPRGKYLSYYLSGEKCWEVEYQEGQLHGKHSTYNIDGKKSREVEYYHGKLISGKEIK